ncbi:hypothetical protein RI845_01350 [Thalassotalea nanhaiensis]|uniref:Nif11-like leader peptide family natural product n=1 Tax=Thalassotalea nanhaiensis TaxID=3065648 RepID=A0ABY9TM05_9GAMM|nr:hypothetical protein RI845_01350 [Colwelliaceae bacterium SQ345]
MKLFDKAKEITDKVTESVTSFSSDEVIANTLIKAIGKQEKVNAILKEKGCNYRVADIELGMGVPPSVTFGVRRVDEPNASEKNSMEISEQ